MRIGVKLTRTASTTLDVGSVIAAASNPRRFLVESFIVGSDATPAENAFLWELYRRTGVATAGTAPTSVVYDPADTVATTLVYNQAPTTNGTGGSTAIISIALNQRATYTWQPRPGSELIAPATASNGWAWATPTSAAVAVQASLTLVEL